MKVAVVTVGAVLEWTGIVLIAWPEVLPRLRRVKAAVARGVFRLRRWVRRRLGRVGSTTIDLGRAEEVNLADHVSALLMPGESATLEYKVDFLLRQYERTEGRLSEIDRTLEEHPRRWNRDIERAKGQLAVLMEAKVEAVRDAHIRVRLWGIAFVLVGLPLLAWANFL